MRVVNSRTNFFLTMVITLLFAALGFAGTAATSTYVCATQTQTSRMTYWEVGDNVDTLRAEAVMTCLAANREADACSKTAFCKEVDVDKGPHATCQIFVNSMRVIGKGTTAVAAEEAARFQCLEMNSFVACSEAHVLTCSGAQL